MLRASDSCIGGISWGQAVNGFATLESLPSGVSRRTPYMQCQPAAVCKSPSYLGTQPFAPVHTVRKAHCALVRCHTRATPTPLAQIRQSQVGFLVTHRE